MRGTPRDSLHTLDTLLNLDGGVKREMVTTDTAPYGDMAFGLYTMDEGVARLSLLMPAYQLLGPLPVQH
ncbi:Tn3 family transposase [Streptomyces sp. NPDC097610]|uniref:Tn3 family transposase n=1 Tax=Streptomyces sp. NPDC097610 TaxID=3157227 RepID=UPI003318285D